MALEITSKGLLTYLTTIHMEKTLIRRNIVTLKFIPNTVLFGISYDKPDLYIAFLCFIVEFNFRKAKKGPKTF